MAFEIQHEWESFVAGVEDDVKRRQATQSDRAAYLNEYHANRSLSFFGLSRETSPENLKAEFRKRAKQLHPDAGGDSAAFNELLAHFNRALAALTA